MRLILTNCLLCRQSTTLKIRQLPPQYLNCAPECHSEAPLQLLEIGHIRYRDVFPVFIQEYELSEEERLLPPDTAEGNLLTKRPYQIPNTQGFIDAFTKCVVANAAYQVEKMLDNNNKLTWEIFCKAFRVVKTETGLKVRPFETSSS